MPYTLDNPPATVKNLPKGAQRIFIDAFNAVYEETEDETKARQAAWANVKRKYKKEGDKWVPKALVEVSLTITKATLQPDGSLRWQATASDTAPDSYGERTSLQLFQDWIQRAESGQGVAFLSPPRKPFLGLSHYPDLDGLGEAGVTEQMFVDGKQFKAGGSFLGDHPLGKALFEAVHSERELVKRGETVEQPIRISAAWWDLEHSHGSFVFTRRSLLDVCPMCAQGAGDKVYLKGQLDHFAATRVPVNPRTELALEEKSMGKKTRRDDAASIVGEELADELEQQARLVGKSEADAERDAPEGLVIKADEGPDTSALLSASVEQAMMKTVGGEKYPASDFLVVEDAKSPSTWHLQVKRNGKADHGLMGGAWAALFDPQGHRGKKYEGPNKDEAKRKLKALYKAENMEMPMMKADVEQMADGMSGEMEYRPMGGAMSMADAEAHMATREMKDKMYNHWDMFRMVMENILDAPDDVDKQATMSTAIKEFGDRVNDLKAHVSHAYLVALANVVSPAPAALPAAPVEAEKGDMIMSEQSNPTNSPEAVLGTAIQAALENQQLTREAKSQAIQDALNGYVTTVKAQLDAVAPPAPGEQIADALKAALQPLAEQIGLLSAKLGAQPVATVAVPQQKSYVPAPVGGQQPQAAGPQAPLRAMIRRSVGIVE